MIRDLVKRLVTINRHDSDEVKKTYVGLSCVDFIINRYADVRTGDVVVGAQPADASNVTLRQVIKMLADNGIASNGFECSRKELEEVPLPAIVHWELSRFVVLIQIEQKLFRIFDPQIGEITYSAQEFDRYYSDVALIIEHS